MQTDNGNIQRTPPAGVDSPACSRCGSRTRIYGIEPHIENMRTDVYTYVCDSCETVEVRLVPVSA